MSKHCESGEANLEGVGGGVPGPTSAKSQMQTDAEGRESRQPGPGRAGAEHSLTVGALTRGFTFHGLHYPQSTEV